MQSKHITEARRVASYDQLAAVAKVKRIPGVSESHEERQKFLESQASKAMAIARQIARGAARNNMSVQDYAPLYWRWYHANRRSK